MAVAAVLSTQLMCAKLFHPEASDGPPLDFKTRIGIAIPNTEQTVTWMGLDFETNEQVLVPRKETELLARAALELLKTVEAAPIRVIDMCCGAGNLACALAHARPDIRVWASDLTDACVALRGRTSRGTGSKGASRFDRAISFRRSPMRTRGLRRSRRLQSALHFHGEAGGRERPPLLDGQPREAFDAGPYGLAIHHA